MLESDPSLDAVRGSALRACGLVQRGSKCLGQLYRVVIGPEMHEADPRLLGKHVVVDRRHIGTIGAQRADDSR
jgi:hypothetical protein